jgi:hypothetical protein
MNWQNKSLAITGLRWVLGLVVLLESVQFTLSSSVARLLTNMGLPLWIRPALGGSEIVAVLLFLIPPSYLLGGYLLLVVFAFAIVLHLLHGEFEVGALLVYIMAVIVCLTHHHRPARKSSDDAHIAHDR